MGDDERQVKQWGGRGHKFLKTGALDTVAEASKRVFAEIPAGASRKNGR
jgi:hypothetical protein